MSIRVLLKDYPHRAIALSTATHALVLRHSPTSTEHNGNASTASLGSNGAGAARCMVEFARLDDMDLGDYRALNSVNAHGTLGLITVNGDVFLVVVNGSRKVADVRPGETVQRIHSVGFYCLNSASYDALLNDEVNPYPTDTIDEEGYEMGFGRGKSENPMEHPCLALKKLLSSGTFYYSSDFDMTRRLQERSSDAATVSIDSLDAGFLWNSYMIQPLVDFRSRLAQREKQALDASGILTSAIRGFALTVTVPSSSSPVRAPRSGLPSQMTLISRLSCRRAGTRFNARGIDDDGNVANFVESETIFYAPTGLCFSYTQVRGSVPLFWEQATGLLPGQQKITITRSPEATQPAFDKHFEHLELSYGAIHVVNLLSNEKPNELELTHRYRHHIRQSPMNYAHEQSKEHELIKLTEYDFHAETRGPGGYEMASMIQQWIRDSADGFAYYLSEDIEEHARSNGNDYVVRRPTTILQQEGVFRTNCLDCLDRTNLVQTIISRMALEILFNHKTLGASQDFWARHSSMWADNGDALSRIYAGTGALKSSFTRHGKMSLAGALADARKSATRMYINNFADKGRQNTIDMLLGRLMGQVPVHLYDPINDFVIAELNKRSAEFTESEVIHILAGTFNLNGKTHGLHEDLAPWLCPEVVSSQQCPEIVAVGFQEIVELSPQQIMSTDPARRQAWESAVRNCLNENAAKHGQEEYVLLRGGQLVGASLSVFVKAGSLKSIKNVEGSLKKTGMSGMAGNKGAVAIRMEYANTSICFVTAHLAAGFANYEERNRDYKTISHGLRFQRNRSIEDHDTVIWLGDFNYRIGLSNEKVQKLCHVGDFETLYENDQLNLQMVAGLTFPYYSEARITFLPTYKYDIGTDTYDTSEKARIPAWCDRILRKGDNIRQINYDCAPLRFSDHRPVYATFQCLINKIDEKRKDQLSQELYGKRKEVVGDTRASSGAAMEDTDDEDLLGYESVEPGLPPASSDRRKWWLDNGLPARSRVQPSSNDHFPNPKRPSNPFTPSPEPDWVEVRTTGRPEPPPARGTQRAHTVDFNDVGTSVPSSVANPATSLRPSRAPNPTARKLIAPPFNVGPPSFTNASNSPSVSHLDGPTDLRRTPSAASTRSLPALHHRPTHPTPAPNRTREISRKAAPPIPTKKPSLHGTPTAPPLRYRDEPDSGAFSDPDHSRPLPPPPRRSMAERRPVGMGNGVGSLIDASDERPALPPRTGTGLSARGRNLMDEEPEDMNLKGWEVLRPAR
ncbi:Inositol-1,4,5-trisphosphate 5-phosphatase 1 [Didymosphaeria variabile]|uniref:phosphoinositide 5-phosphatase n=1 Tax=Didymosphaeria variabile TaxID=1932322 RepID=A0A9W9C5W6_9PLEO|nr:Inositol-1,4,5-trisphosphate 5-phosphatase 1 [Didymosphaeria variabile]KAJ4344445.1 Inositol-1,4,5-trisphosphate 5-phosphatase 1 [Didymosphaeria variabile]